VVHATSECLETEFVCIPRPVERSDRPDGGALSYRVRFRTVIWVRGEAPKLRIQILEGDPKFSV
jgi:alkaline phosphatase D